MGYSTRVAVMANQPIAKHILEQNAVLRNTLAPLARYYDDLGTVEMRINRPGKVVTERRGIGKEEHDAPELTIAVIEHICKSLANGEGLQFDSSKAPKLSCVLPVIKHRFECLVGNSVQSGLSMAIRCKHPFTPEWSDFISDYKPAKSKLITNDNARAFASANTKEWEQVKDNKTIAMDVKLKAYLRDAMDQEKNIIISGATNTGKTTLLNMMLGFLPADRRVVGAEDTPELDLDRFWDGVGLIAAREAGTGSGLIDWRQLYDHKMRITPDNIIYGEISTQNAIGALAVLNSGAKIGRAHV